MPTVDSTATAHRKPSVVNIVGLIALAGWLAWVGWQTTQHSVSTSPDEAANRFMATSWAQTGSLHVPTALSAAQLAAFHPRSFAIHDTQLWPGSFVGFVMLVGWLQRLGTAGPIILTLLISGLSIVAWYRLGRAFWEPAWALGAAALMTSLPVLIAHQVLPYTQPTLYVSFLMLAGYALLQYQQRKTATWAVIVGLLYGLALFIRPVEVLFTGPMIAVVILAHRKYRHFLITVLTTLVVQLPWLIVAYQTFHAVLGSGYSLEGVSVSTAGSALPLWRIVLTPAGGAWSWHWLVSVRDYLLLLYPAMSAMSAVALWLYFRRKFIEPIKIFKIGMVILLGVYYLAYYGSWNLYVDATASRIGSAASYARYWLPLYIAMTAGVIVFLRTTLARFRPLALTMIGVLVAVNFWTWWSHPSGYRAVIKDDRHLLALRQQVLTSTEPDSLVIAGQNDKLLVGYRLTSYAYPTAAGEWQLLNTMVKQRPVYILAINPPVSQPSLAEQAAKQHLTLKLKTNTADGPLWQLVSTGGQL